MISLSVLQHPFTHAVGKCRGFT